MVMSGTPAYTLGVDIGGTKIETALVDASGRILASHYQLNGAAKDPQSMIAAVIDSAKICQHQSGQKAAATGVGIAGQIDRISGIVHRSPNLPAWQEVPLAEQLAAALRMPVFVNNDARAITLGEWQFGAGRGLSDLVCLFVGTGVGGGVVAGGHLLEGCSNSAGEIGHITIVAGGRKCHCPNDGCLEAYTGGWAIAERAQDSVRANPQAGQALVNLAGNVEGITSITVARAYQNGDPLAQRLIKDTVKYLAAGVVSIVNAFNPCRIVLGGGVVLGLPDLVPAVEKRVRAQALQTAVGQLQITTAALGDKAGVVGAAVMARQHTHLSTEEI